MTDTQLYFAIGIPSGLFALNFIAILWQARGLERSFGTRFDALDRVIEAKFEAQTQGLQRVEGVLSAKLDALTARVTAIETRLEGSQIVLAPR